MATTNLTIVANRENAQASTGPTSLEGKKRSAMNAIRHGLFSESPILPGEDPAAYETFCQAYVADLQPQGAIEEAYVAAIASTQWRLLRCARIENSILTAEDLNIEQQIDGIARFSLYEGRLFRKLNQILRDLRQAQAERKALAEAQLQEAIEVAAECRASNHPFDPAQFGFVFSASDIKARLNRRERLQAAQSRKRAA